MHRDTCMINCCVVVGHALCTVLQNRTYTHKIRCVQAPDEYVMLTEKTGTQKNPTDKITIS